MSFTAQKDFDFSYNKEIASIWSNRYDVNPSETVTKLVGVYEKILNENKEDQRYYLEKLCIAYFLNSYRETLVDQPLIDKIKDDGQRNQLFEKNRLEHGLMFC